MRVVKKFEKKGYFWLPTAPEIRLPGTLTVRDKGRVELEIFGVFATSFEASRLNPNIGRILGTIDTFGEVTLEDCFHFAASTSHDGTCHAQVFVGLALLGLRCEQEAIQVDNLSFRTDLVDEWLDVSEISVEYDWDNQVTSIISSKLESETFDLTNGLSLRISFPNTFPERRTASRIEVAHFAQLTIFSEFKRDLSVLLDAAHRLTNLICLATTATLAITDLSTRLTESEGKEDEKSGRDLRIFYLSPSYTKDVPIRQRHEMLFLYGQINGDPVTVFRNWFEAYDRIRPSMNLYFATMNIGHGYLESRFIALAHGLETYHRRTSKETLKADEEYSAMVARILENCPVESKEWLDGRLQHGNELSLGTRLKRIIEPFKSYMGNSKERNRIVKKIADTRNYLTHYSDGLRELAASDEELSRLCDILEGLFQLVLLSAAGFNDTHFADASVGSDDLWIKVQLAS